MGRLFDSPVHLMILLLVIVLLFGAKRLPDAARGLGRSMRILKSEVQDMKEEPATPAKPNTPGQLTAGTDEVADRVRAADESVTEAPRVEPRREV